MRDRTKELGNQGAESSDEDEERTLMIKPGSAEKEEKENEAFFKKVQEVREGLETLRKKVSDLETKQKTILGVALPEDSMKKELQLLRDEIKTIGGQIHKKIKSLEPKKTEEDGKYVPISTRMQKTQHAILSRNFVDLMGYCNNLQANYRDRNVERIERQLKITCSSATQEEVESMIETGQTDVFTQNILGDATATKQALNEIETRRDEILKLEKSIKDLSDLFQYLHMEVEAQGEMIDNIENNILNSTNYVEKAVTDTAKAVVSSSKARKVKCSHLKWSLCPNVSGMRFLLYRHAFFLAAMSHFQKRKSPFHLSPVSLGHLHAEDSPVGEEERT
ncbi:syntaxin-4 [Clupea harengus]|uniref:Syntaxin-4 n=1 Tax=Clupea harengus TaxID=7950 RepID=A0A6P8EZB5_CLUHA|nr:syntaxin-4 [Clupea harengus]